jgi:hypothetical protein
LKTLNNDFLSPAFGGSLNCIKVASLLYRNSWARIK